MKYLKLFNFFMWVSVLSSVIASVPDSVNTAKSKTYNGSHKKSDEQARSQARVLFQNFYGYTYFPWTPYNYCVALAVVLAIPLQLKGRNVYMATNFETNFYIPYFDKGQGLVPLPFAHITAGAVNQGTKLYYANGGEVRKLDENDENFEPELNRNETVVEKLEAPMTTNSTEKPIIDSNVTFKKSNSTTHSTKKPKDKKSKNSKPTKKAAPKTRVNREILTTLLSRKKFYKMLQHKLELAGFNGEQCLLKAICETAKEPLIEHNGVLGEIMHILFTPTASRDEKLPQRYYDAITHGQAKRCRYYNTLCPKGIFDFITKTIKY